MSAVAARIGAEECCSHLVSQLTETVQKQVAEALRPIANITLVNHAITHTINVSFNDPKVPLRLQGFRLESPFGKAIPGKAVGTVGSGLEWLK